MSEACGCDRGPSNRRPGQDKRAAIRKVMCSMQRSQTVAWFHTVFVAALVVAASVISARAAGNMANGPVSGLPVPRFVSLKPDKVNVRGGPTRDHEVTFVYNHSGLPGGVPRGAA